MTFTAVWYTPNTTPQNHSDMFGEMQKLQTKD